MTEVQPRAGRQGEMPRELTQLFGCKPLSNHVAYGVHLRGASLQLLLLEREKAS